jgi:hypothetical protein
MHILSEGLRFHSFYSRYVQTWSALVLYWVRHNNLDQQKLSYPPLKLRETGGGRCGSRLEPMTRACQRSKFCEGHDILLTLLCFFINTIGAKSGSVQAGTLEY